MATQTPNLNLVLPDYADKADIGVVNDNFKKIDDFSGGGKVEEWLDSIQKKADESLAKIDQDATSYLNNIQKEANESLNEIENKAKNSLESIPDDYEVLAGEVSSLKDQKADVIIDTSARAATHGLHAQPGQISVTMFGKTTEDGDGEKSKDNPYKIVGIDDARIRIESKNLWSMGDQAFTTEKYVTLDSPLPAGDYTLSALIKSEGTGECQCVYYAEGLQHIGTTYLKANSGKRVSARISASVPIHTFILRSSGNYTQSVGLSATWGDIQIERGSAETEYTPYFDAAKEYSMPLLPDKSSLYGDGKDNDTISNDEPSGCDVRLAFDGSEAAWIMESVGVFKIDLSEKGSVAYPLYSDKLQYSNRFIFSGENPNATLRFRISNGVLFVATSGTYTTLASFKETLVSEPLIVYYRSTAYTKAKEMKVCKVIRRWRKIENYAGESVGSIYVSGTGGLDTGTQVVYKLSALETYFADNVTVRIPDEARGAIPTVKSDAEMEVTYPIDAKHYVDMSAYAKYREYGLPVLNLIGDISGMSKDDAVTLNYTYEDRVGTCTCKWQGSSSLSYEKKNYTIKFDEAFEAKEGWGEQKKYCFKANWIDASHSRNVVSAKKWGQIVKSRTPEDAVLSALPNGGAIDGFPCIITINGKFQGLFTWNIPKDGWMYGMGSGANEAIVCADTHVPATQFKAAATLNGDFDLEYVSDEDNSAWVLTSLNRMLNAVINSDGSDLDTTVAQYLDWQSAIDYYIFTVLIMGRDMTDKNYLLYTYDGVKWHFGAYDMDSTWGLVWTGKSLEGANAGLMMSDYSAAHRAMWLIRMYKTDALKARYAELRESAMSEDGVATDFGNFIGAIPSGLYNIERDRWPLIPSTSVNDLHQITDWYRRRVAVIDAEVEALQVN